MLEEILELSRMDPDVMQAEMNVRHLLWEFRNSTDPLVKRAFKEMVFDALEEKDRLRIKFQAREAVSKLNSTKSE
jgi:hypothetical protein